MAYPVSPGFPQQSGIMIPEIWAGKLLTKFYTRTVFGAIANTDYEGLIKGQGDTVHIRTTPDIIIRPYVKGQSLDTQHPDPGMVDLVIDKGAYYNAVIDDVDAAQFDINAMEDWTKDASMQMQTYWDRLILQSIYADASAYNVGLTAGFRSGNINLGTTASQLTVGNASGNVSPTALVLRIMQALDEQDVPEDDRFIVVPSWLAQRLKNSDLKNAFLTGDDKSPLRNGMIGGVDRATIYRSNQLATGTATTNYTYVMGGQKSALTFASQLVKNEKLKAQTTFGEILRGLQVTGWKVVKPEALVTAVCTPGGE